MRDILVHALLALKYVLSIYKFESKFKRTILLMEDTQLNYMYLVGN
jgi:hypothetical protein